MLEGPLWNREIPWGGIVVVCPEEWARAVVSVRSVDVSVIYAGR